ncbi:response regulator transcription factor [Pseudaestuariivita rosea]|uniref:response regulator transcription factor n=1 Tax=Pseudaestuariivita rosea TaxID=2763263 RepID=UPI001ABBE091|nr:response regulator transcription factor [Pseudaestuariivita rosea]
MTTAQILVVDDDPQIRDLLRIALAKADYAVRLAGDGAAALREISAQPPDLIVLDIGLPEMDGLEVCRRIRASHATPVLFLTARDDEIDRVLGFEMGADDYVTKPFSPRELVARIKAILKRTNGAPAEHGAQRRGALELDATRHFCAVSGVAVTLTATEMAILAKLMQRPDQISPRPQLTDAVYGTNIHVSDRTLDSHLRNLRRKLADAGCADAIETVHGVGVRMGECRGT